MTLINYKTIIQTQLKKRATLIFWVTLVGVVIFGVVQAMARLGHTLDNDEAFTANMIHQSWIEMFTNFSTESAGYLYYLLLKLWVLWLGESEIALQSFSLVCFILTILATGLSARKMADNSWAGIIAALLVSISTYIGLYFATVVRSYSLLSSQVALGMLMYAYFLQPSPTPQINLPQKKLLWGLTVLNIASLLTHPLYIFFMCAYTITSLFNSRKQFWALVGCNMLSFIVWNPVLYWSIQLPTISWMQTPTLADLKNGFYHLWGQQEIKLLLIYGFIFALLNFQKAKQFFTHKHGLMLLSLVSITVLLPFVVSQVKPMFLASRTPALFLPIICILVAIFVAQVGEWRTAFILLVFLAFSSGQKSLETFREPDPLMTRYSVRFVAERVSCGDTIILGGFAVNDVAYYLKKFNVPLCVEQKVFPDSTKKHPGWMNFPELLKNRKELELEAKTLVTELTTPQRKMTVWFFYSEQWEAHLEYTEIGHILNVELDKGMTPVQALDLNGWSFNRVLVYTSNIN